MASRVFSDSVTTSHLPVLVCGFGEGNCVFLYVCLSVCGTCVTLCGCVCVCTCSVWVVLFVRWDPDPPPLKRNIMPKNEMILQGSCTDGLSSVVSDDQPYVWPLDNDHNKH